LANVPDGWYCVTVTDNNSNTATACGTVGTAAYLTPEICMVTVDTASDNCVVVWEKPVTSGIDQYYIYRESSISGIYNLIGTQNYSTYSTFTDVTSNSLQQQYRYKLALHDLCGNTTSQGAYHQTIHLTVSAGLGGSWNLAWNDYIGFSFTTYNIYRGTTSGNVTLLNSVSSSVLSYTDLAPPPGTIYYMIEAVPLTTCSPSKQIMSFSSVTSNIASTNTMVGVTNQASDNMVSINLNPGSDMITIETTAISGNATLYIFNMQGQQIFSDALKQEKTEINISTLAHGMYFVKVNSEKGIAVKKFVKE
jgi:hypothetical protein